MQAHPRPSRSVREADGWYACFSCADVPIQPLPTGQEIGIDLGIEAFATLSDGRASSQPGWYRKAERALKTPNDGSVARKKGSTPPQGRDTLAKAHQKVRRQRAGLPSQDGARTGASNDVIYHEDLQTANMVRNHHLAKSHLGRRVERVLTILTSRQHAPVGGRRGATCIHQPDVFRLRRTGPKGLSVRWHSARDAARASIGTRTQH